MGNTQIKTAIFSNAKLEFKQVFKNKDFLKQLDSISSEFAIKHTILSSVVKLKKKELDDINSFFTPLILNRYTKLPFLNKYQTPETLGVDRIALVANAVVSYPNQNVLIIDAGTCITYDFVNSKKEYYGGSISPGIEMRYKSIHSFTSNLPKLNLIHSIPKFGNSTQNAIHRGVLNGIIQEIEGIIEQYKSNYKKLTVVLTGGDTIFLAKNLKSTIFANPNFLLEGLNRILIYNLDE